MSAIAINWRMMKIMKTSEEEIAEMRDDLSRIKTACRLCMIGETSEQECIREVYKLAMKHAHGHYPK